MRASESGRKTSLMKAISGNLVRYRHDIDPAILSRELPAHALLKHDPMTARLQRAEFEAAFAGINDIRAVAEGPLVFVVEEQDGLWIVRRHVDFAPRAVFPQADRDRLPDAGRQRLFLSPVLAGSNGHASLLVGAVS